MYVDESGDPGILGSPTRYFLLTGLVVHELRWRQYLDHLLAFRRRMRGVFGLLMREEIHAAHFINKPGPLVRIRRNDRLAILRHHISELATMSDLSIINILVDKDGKRPDYSPLDVAWRALVQRFSDTMHHRNFPGPANPDETGFVIPDDTDAARITRMLRRMRRFNPIPHRGDYGSGYRNLRIANLVEDPFFKRSEHSYFIQAADTIAYFLYQQESPSAYLRRRGGRSLFERLGPLLCRAAAPGDPQGIKRF